MNSHVEGKLLPKIEKACTKYKFNYTKRLGKGCNGTAYDIGNDIVLKITSDFSEANASNRIRGKKLEYVTEIYDVYSVKRATEEEAGLFLIFQKKMDPMPEKDNEMFGNFFIFLSCEGIGSEKIHLEPISELEKKIEPFFEKYGKYHKKTERNLKLINQLLEFYTRSKKELLQYGVDYNDYHSGNIMMQGDEYKIIDLGFSKASKTDINHLAIESYLRKKFGV